MPAPGQIVCLVVREMGCRASGRVYAPTDPRRAVMATPLVAYYASEGKAVGGGPWKFTGRRDMVLQGVEWREDHPALVTR